MRAALVLAAVVALAGCGGSGSGGGSGTTTTAAPADAVVKTSEGTFAIRLDAKDSPHTVASFEKLARKGFFDGTIFHRIVPGFVIQGGDPSGSGSGGPGYTTTDPPPADARYTKGVVAMAKTSQQPAGTAGSQFFVVTGADAGLPPEYALLGKVVSGMDVVEKIGELGDPQTERPTKRVVVESISIRGR
jgi:cyclophilin family peptidyl-prolyl cis-trans isomerase